MPDERAKTERKRGNCVKYSCALVLLVGLTAAAIIYLYKLGIIGGDERMQPPQYAPPPGSDFSANSTDRSSEEEATTEEVRHASSIYDEVDYGPESAEDSATTSSSSEESDYGNEALTFQPKFAEPIVNISVAIGRDATFSCHVRHLGGYRVGWIKLNTREIQAVDTHVLTRNQRVSVSHLDVNTWNLHIRTVTEEDRGGYMCQINTDPKKSQIGYLDVVIPPDFIPERTSPGNKGSTTESTHQETSTSSNSSDEFDSEKSDLNYVDEYESESETNSPLDEDDYDQGLGPEATTQADKATTLSELPLSSTTQSAATTTISSDHAGVGSTTSKKETLGDDEDYDGSTEGSGYPKEIKSEFL